MPMTPLRYLLRHESLNSEIGKVSEWCNLQKIKLNKSKTKTMIVSRSRTMHSLSPTLIIGGTVLKESDDLDIVGVTFDSRWLLRSIFALLPEQLLKGLISWSPGECSMIDRFLRRVVSFYFAQPSFFLFCTAHPFFFLNPGFKKNVLFKPFF